MAKEEKDKKVVAPTKVDNSLNFNNPEDVKKFYEMKKKKAKK